MRELSPAQKERREHRIHEFLKKAEKEKRMPESYFAHLRYEIALLGWQGYANIHAEFSSINPFVVLNYLLSGELPKDSRPMRKSASEALWAAAILGDVKHAQGLISEMGADVNHVEDGVTPLHNAIRRKRLGVAEVLLRNGAENRSAYGYSTPLLQACSDGFWQAIPFLVKHGVDVNKPIKYRKWHRFGLGYKTWQVYPIGWTLIGAKNQAKVCQTLLENGASIDVSLTPEVTARQYLEMSWEKLSTDMQKVFSVPLQKPVITHTDSGDIIDIPEGAYTITPLEPEKVTTHPAVFPELPMPQNTRV